jgi:hypothetical protein
MMRKPRTWLVLVVLVAVAVVFIAPSVDLEPTALRSWQAACAIFLAIAASLQVIAQLSIGSVGPATTFLCSVSLLPKEALSTPVFPLLC